MTEMQNPEPAGEAGQTRRLWLLNFLLGGLAAVAFAIPFVGYLLGPLLKPKKDKWIDLGPAKDFPPNQTRLAKFDNPLRQPWDGMTASTGAYVRCLGDNKFHVLSYNCTHLGCPVSWFPQSGLFLCPCHGGVYYEDGAHASGPPPRGLYEYAWEVRENGHLYIHGGHLPTLQDTFRENPKAEQTKSETKSKPEIRMPGSEPC